MTRVLARTASTDARRPTSASLPLRGLAAALVALFALDNLLLLRLLGVSPPLVIALALILPPALAFLCWKAMPGQQRIGVHTILLCFAVAFLLLLLGGEGRLFYANADWQIRDAVLADLGRHRWPFDYWLDGRAQVLRAPVGMYLVPALLGGASQLSRDWALLAHNSLILGLLLAQGAALFKAGRARLIALIVFVFFSGLDVLGTLIHQSVTGTADWDHIEHWAANYQYSSHLTQIFWVPQHAFAGWALALAYLLWRKELAPVGLFLVSIALVALWSPFAFLGALPFAAYASIRTLLTGEWDRRDVFLCLAAMIAIPALVYLSADVTSVGGGFLLPNGGIYVLFLLLEVMPFLWLLLCAPDKGTDWATIIIAGACLFLLPLWTIGANNDFQMRSSILPLALIAFAFADRAGRLERRKHKAWFLVILALGSVTGTVEIARALSLSATPAPLCSLAGVWDRQTGFVVPHASYFAARAAFPFSIHPTERVSGTQPASCWDRPWRTHRFSSAGQQERP